MEVEKKIQKIFFRWFLCVLATSCFVINWWLLFFRFWSQTGDGFWFYTISLFLGIFFLLIIIFLEKSKPFSWLVLLSGNILIWIFFCIAKGISFFGLFPFFSLAILFFFSGRKAFEKEQENQIKVQPTVSLRKPYRGLIFALAILFSSAFYFIGQEKIKNNDKNAEKEKIFASIIEDSVNSLKKFFPDGQLLNDLNLDLTIDDYIKKNLPPTDRSMLGKQVQLPDGTIAIYNEALKEKMEKVSIEASREQLSHQFNQNLTGREKIYQVIGIIIDQKISDFSLSLQKSWPNFFPVLLVQALSVFFLIVWLGGIFRFLVLKMIDWFLQIFIHYDWVEKKKSLVEKEEVFF